MTLDQYDANYVLQLTQGYLETVIRRYMATQSNHCLDTQGLTIQLGDGPHVQADDVTYEFTNVELREEDDGDVVASSTITTIDGILESGPDANSLSQVNKVTVPIPITVDVADNNDTLVIVEVEHPDPRQDNPTFEFDLAPLSTNGVSLTLGSDAVSLTVLSDGTLAAGITFDESPSGDLTSFKKNYDESKDITESDDWALVLDTWTVQQYISEVDFDENTESVRNATVEMTGIDSAGIKLDVDGEAEASTIFGTFWGSFNAKVIAKPKVSDDEENSLNIQYTVTDPKLTEGSSWLNPFINLKKRLEKKDEAKGNRELISPVAFGEESNTAGRFTGTSATTLEDELVVFGKGSRQLPDDPSLTVSQNEEPLVPACDAGGDPQGTFSVTYDDTDDDLPPVDVCRVVVDDDDVVLSGNGVNSPSIIESGDTWEYDARYTGSGSGVTTATVRIVTNAGIEEVDLRIYRTAGTVEGPESLEFSGETKLFSCSCNTRTKAVTGIEITNVGSGPVELCDVWFSASGDGSWYLEDGVSGEVLYPDENFRTQVVYEASTADEWRSAKMQVETTGNDITVELEAIVHDYEGHGIPPEGEVNCRGPFMPGGETVCLDPAEIYALNQLIQDTLEILFDDAPFGGDLDVWEGVLPECGPRMLCVDFLEVSLAGLPAGFELEFLDQSGGPRYYHRTTGGSDTMLVPMTGEPLAVTQTVPEAAGSGNVSGYVKPWRLQRIDHWDNVEIRSIVTAGDHLLALADDNVTALALEEEELIEVGHYELKMPATGLATLGNRFAAYGPRGVQFLGSRNQPDLRPIETAAPLSGLIPLRNADVAGRLAYGVDDDNIRLYDLGDREEFNVLKVINRQLTGEVESVFTTESTLYLAGNGSIEAWDLQDVPPRFVGAFEIDRDASVFGGEDMLLATADDGSARLLSVDNETGFERRGRISFPEEWWPLLPVGQPALINGGEYIASRSIDGSGVNVLQPQAAKYPTDPTSVVQGSSGT